MDMLDEAITEVNRKIERERSVIHGALSMKRLTQNPAVHQQLHSNIEEAKKSIIYLEERLGKLQLRKSGSFTSTGSSEQTLKLPYTSTNSSKSISSGLSNVDSNLDLLNYDTPLTITKISFLLQQLEFKLSVEEQYRRGIEKMAKLYEREHDRRSIAEAEKKYEESAQKISLLQQSLKRYHDLHIEIDDDDVPTNESRLNLNARRPQSGLLKITVNSIRNVSHSAGLSKHTETLVVIRAEDLERARTRSSRAGKFYDSFEINLEKTNEVEIIVYEKKNEKVLLPVALLWVRLSDLVEKQRRKKVEQEVSDKGWVSADHMQNQRLSMFLPSSLSSSKPESMSPKSPEVNSKVNGWFSLEPLGQIHLTMNFTKNNVRKRPLDARLGRQGAIRQRKESVHEVYGHRFLQHQFYQIMRCALCGEFLKSAIGMQCKDCLYTCHRKCYSKVVTKCISKSSDSFSSEYEKINHRIPHHFESHTNIGANWCCHCGYILPFGRKNARKCTECGITAHAQCVHLVPDFCGMSMEMANRVLSEIRTTKQKAGNYNKKSNRPAHISKQAHSEDKISRTSPVGTLNDTPSTPTSQKFSIEPIKRKPVHAGAMELSVKKDTKDQTSEGSNLKEIFNQKEADASVKEANAIVSSHDISVPGFTSDGKPKRIGLEDFNFLTVLGKGNFGKVMLAEYKSNKELYAIKVLKKKFILENDEVESTKSEKRVFLVANRERHPFLVNLHSCFQTETRIYFVMDFVSGGDLMLHIQQQQFSRRRAQFYAAEVCLALKYFHDNGIIYRDLKLDNILLSPDGHIKVADYGLCKEDMWYNNTTATFCGTPEFMAPEILLEQNYTRSVDWWAFGVLIYQMLLGQSPFRGDDEEEIFDAILSDEPLYPIHMPRDSVSILQHLLARDPNKRLGSGENDAEDVMAHPFFNNINWDDIYHKQTQPPYIPQLDSQTDTKYFDEEFTRELPVLTPVQSVLTDEMQEEFRGFSYFSHDDSSSIKA
ncbi:AGC/PKC protein kinase Pck2 [Schizosaccharomyces cryophilus OY26]|uniref:protein kinase C n=1 Tax=Schizosaccharomyces cryophilus (strain OY26 / ATCC MYA-4695 / CBS 11777 / NBRC 106824 / NRRL Y48691) TaxID=653667 RepID=S9XAQ4_SCHCR|nr:AGC/PKC protein kinase Pck2 [Schizosaccharomyces cryophilus OY26]EPY54237.1 AGC/PKC protein kinase Pck2 [Schizosaccharomyces cryophilus OY26]